MSTRAEQVEACRKAACWDEVENPSPTAAVLHHAAATITRDGELRERLKKLVEEWRAEAARYERKMSAQSCRDAVTWLNACADRLSALLKETRDEG